MGFVLALFLPPHHGELAAQRSEPPADSLDRVEALRPSASLRPDSVYRAPSGVAVQLLRTPDASTVALDLRASAPERTEALELLADLARERVASLARRLGATAQVSAEPYGLRYRVAGAHVDLDALLRLLSEAAAAPEPGGRSLDEARRRLSERRAARRERPGSVLRGRLREALGLSPMVGAAAEASPIGTTAIRRVWSRTHQPDRLTLVVAGDVEPVLLASAVEALPGGAPAFGSIPEGRREAAAEVQVLRNWKGIALELAPREVAAAMTASRILAGRLRRAIAMGSGMEGAVELWRSRRGATLVLIAAAHPDDRSPLTDLMRTVSEAPLAEARVGEAVGYLRTELLLAGRTPRGLADVVAREAALGAHPRGAAGLFEALGAVDRDAVFRIMERLEGEGVIREVRP